MALNYNILKNIVNENDNVLVGLSGGADSMCLIDLLDKYRQTCKFNLLAVHINHNLRNLEALRDQNFVKQFCKERNIRLIVENVFALEYAKNNLKTIEQSARELRYDMFNKVMKREGYSKLLVAHHKDDQAETVLMHIARGSSLKGAGGMSINTNNIYRPLLNFTRNDILKYNQENNIFFINDSSNDDTKYVRNYIRKVVLPQMSEIYPNIVNSLCQFAEKCSRDNDFIDKLLPLDMISVKKEECLISAKIKELDYALSSRLVKKAFELIGVFADIEEKHINQILKLASAQNGKKINLPHNIIAIKEYDNIAILKQDNEIEIQEPFSFGVLGIKDFGKVKVELLNNVAEMNVADGCHYIDYDRLPKSVLWRRKQNGDLFKKFGAGTKKLNDFLIDKKIPQRDRKKIPILADDNNVYVVLGVEISDLVKVSEETKQIVKISYEKE